MQVHVKHFCLQSLEGQAVFEVDSSVAFGQSFCLMSVYSHVEPMFLNVNFLMSSLEQALIFVFF
jgi:hypothetical protein